MNGHVRVRLLSAGAIVAPLLLVKAVEMMSREAGPAMGIAAETPVEDTPTIDDKPRQHSQPSPRWEAALGRVNSLRSEACGSSPFLRIETAASTQPEAEVAIVKEPEIVVQMIMAAREGPVALIGGKPRRIGESVDAAGMWIIREIDTTARTVRLEAGSSGRFMTVGVQRRTAH